LPQKAVAFGEALKDEFFTYALQLQKNANAMADARKEGTISFWRYRQPHDVD
jgi:glycine/serine hydroxymethyltransferase